MDHDKNTDRKGKHAKIKKVKQRESGNNGD